MDFYARQEAARRTTRWLLLAFLVSVALVVVGGRCDRRRVMLRRRRIRRPRPRGRWCSPALLCWPSSAAPACSRRCRCAPGAAWWRARWAARASSATRAIRRCRRLHNVVEEMAIASGVTMPEVYVLENEDGINAFAAGNSPADAAIAVTRGAATLLDARRVAGRGGARVQPHPQWRHAPQPAVVRLDLRTAGRRHRRAHRAAELAAHRRPRPHAMARARSCWRRWPSWCWATSACSSDACCRRRCRAIASGSRMPRRCSSRAIPRGLSGALLKIAGVELGLAPGDAGSRRSGAHVVCRGPAAPVRHASAARGAAQGARPVVPGQRTAGAGRRGRARCGAPATGRRDAVRRTAAPRRDRRRRFAQAADRSVRWPARRRHRGAGRHHRHASRCVTPSRRAPPIPEGVREFVRLRRSCARADAGGAGQQGSGSAGRAAPHPRRARTARSSARTCSRTRHSPIRSAGAAPAGRAAAVSLAAPPVAGANARSCATWSARLAQSPTHASTCSSAA